jgi:ABC-type sugar transport system ATPase subunit
MPAPLLEMKAISKSFGGNPVLQAVDFALRPGEVHALVGENGAGKSTLMKILSGVHALDSGEILLDGKNARIAGPHDARRAGIGMIFQEHTLAPHLTVAENILLGLEPVRSFGLIDRHALADRAAEVLDRHHFPLRPSARVHSLSRAEKQLVEIARALTSATRIVVMDEPTAMLSQRECAELFRIIRRLREHGLAIAYISHRMEELEHIADSITILRDGRRVYSGAFSSLDSAEVIRHMVGRKITDLFPAHVQPTGEVALEVEGFGDGVRFRGISFRVHKGEILGIAGLIGAGRTEMARGLFRLETATRGTVRLRGTPVHLGSPEEAIASGLAYLPEDRKISGLFPHLALAHNITIAALGKISMGPLLRLSREARECRELIGRLGIRARSERQPISRLSGGNQQKALIARWLFAGSGILILDEPTQGVDLGARAEIYRVMREIADNGGAIVMISSDLPELLGMSHRIAVMRRGELVATLQASETNQEEIMRYAALA